MRDVGPKCLVAFHEGERRPKAFCLHRHPERVDVFNRQFAFGAGCMQLALEVIERDLAHNGVDHVFDLARQHYLARRIVFCL